MRWSTARNKKRRAERLALIRRIGLGAYLWPGLGVNDAYWSNQSFAAAQS